MIMNQDEDTKKIKSTNYDRSKHSYGDLQLKFQESYDRARNNQPKKSRNWFVNTANLTDGFGLPL